MDVAFSHAPLDLSRNQIRLLQIHCSINDVVSCNVSTFDHESCPPYECLSYVWGDQKDRLAIELNGQQFFVGTNLYSFLELTGKAGIILEDGSAYTSAYLWIDQICIDQQSISERNHQVAKMAQIYRHAKRCIVWLGVSSNIEVARDATQRIIDIVEIISTIETLARTYDACDMPIGDKSFDPDQHIASLFTSDKLQSVFTLLSCEYWTRVWTLGEFWLSADVLLIYGDQAVQWVTLRRFWANFWRGDKSKLNIEQMGGIKYIGHKNMNEERGRGQADFGLHNTASWSLGSVLTEFWDLEASDQKDKVYGLMSIVKEDQRIPIDYCKSSQEVFWDAVKAIHSRSSLTPWYWRRSYVPLGTCMGVSIDEMEDFYHEHLTIIPRNRDAQLDLWRRGQGKQSEQPQNIQN